MDTSGCECNGGNKKEIFAAIVLSEMNVLPAVYIKGPKEIVFVPNLENKIFTEEEAFLFPIQEKIEIKLKESGNGTIDANQAMEILVNAKDKLKERMQEGLSAPLYNNRLEEAFQMIENLRKQSVGP